MTVQDIKTRAKAIIDEATNSVLMTVDDQGFPHPRTMWTAGLDDDFTVYFVTGRTLLKCKQIESNPNVCVFWTLTDGSNIGWNYALLKGRATITDNQGLRDRLLVDELARYFAGGKTDDNYVVIVVKPMQLMVMDSHQYPLDSLDF